MSARVTIGDTVRLKSTGELQNVQDATTFGGVEFVTLSRYGHLSGTVSTAPLLTVKRDEVVLQRLECELVDAE
jgi:hypothetical protein